MRELCRTFVRRFTGLLRRSRFERDLDAELRSHLDMAVEMNLQKGMSAEDARYEARRSFGGVEQAKELYREQRGLPMMETTLQDLRFGLRMLRRSPGFSILAILCLTLGIGANAAVFSWVEGILFRPYPAVRHQERLLALAGTARGETGATALSWPDFLDLRRSCTLFDAFFVSKITGTTLSIGDRAERTVGSIVSANYFDAIGVRPILGRGFEPGEDSGRSAHPVTVISYQLWQGRFKGDPQIVGKTQRLNGRVHTIVGVAPEGFMGRLWAGGCSSGFPRRWRKSLKRADTNWRIAEHGGLKRMCA
jgi:macrolide transport system ATP-binding/permease protein